MLTAATSRIAPFARHVVVIAAALMVVSATAPGIARAQCDTATVASRATTADKSAHGAAAGPVAVILYAAASASEVTFARQPQIDVRLCGGLDSVHVLERRNLPSPVVTGTTYHDVYVAVAIFGRLNAECLTREILGGRSSQDSTSAGKSAGLDCASLSVRGTTPTRPPSDSARHSPRI